MFLPDLVVFLIGLVIGSFLNVCIYRLPRGESLIKPSSRCPECKTPIKWYDNIPVLSYLILKGKCRNCGAVISLQYPVVELLTAFMLLFLFKRFGLSVDFFYYMVFVCFLIVSAFIDFELRVVLPGMCYICMIFGVLLSPFVDSVSFVDSVLGASFGAGLILFLIETYVILRGVEGMGYGDANVMAVVGAFVGWKKVLLVLFAAAVIGSVYGIAYMILQRKNLKAEIPFVPFIFAGSCVTIFFGDDILKWYMGM